MHLVTPRLRRLRWGFAVALALWPFAAGAADVPCPTGAPNPTGPIYLAEIFDLDFCWQAATGGPTYRIETSTNRGPWTQEAVSNENHLLLRRGLGDMLRLRVALCRGSTCSSVSPASKRTFIWPNYDADGTGTVTIRDFYLLRSTLAQPTELARFRTVFGRFLVNGRYLASPPSS